MSSITPHDDNFIPENISIYNNNDDDVNSDDDDNGVDGNKDSDDEDEFSDFISSQWKDSVEIGLIIDYPLPCTNYLENQFEQQIKIDDGDGNEGDNSSDNQRLPSLILSTRLEERSIAPLFDGTQWAGTSKFLICLCNKQ
jgi:hypothetical protein